MVSGGNDSVRRSAIREVALERMLMRAGGHRLRRAIVALLGAVALGGSSRAGAADDIARQRGIRDPVRVSDIQKALEGEGLDGWLLYDFRGANPLAARVVGLGEGVYTRRWFVYIPVRGEPVRIVHRIEESYFRDLPGRARVYVGWEELHDTLRETLPHGGRVAMEYSPSNDIPYVARVDAGTVELIRSLGVEVRSSADLVQRFEACWSPEGLASHRRAAAALMRIKDAAFRMITRKVRAGEPVTEYEVQQEMVRLFREEGLVADGPPIVAAGPHSANPHYEPTADSHAPIRVGEVVLIDLWGKEAGEESLYADITWVGFVGEEVSGECRNIFGAVREARDAAIGFLEEAWAAGRPVHGWEVDDVARAVIRDRGYGPAFIHRTGHSIGREVHGNGVNIDNLETRDARRILPGVGFSIEPGIYLDQFGIRSEIDVYVSEEGVEVTTLPLQGEVLPLLAPEP